MVPLSPWLLFACTAPLVVLTPGTTRSAISFTFNLPIAMSAAGPRGLVRAPANVAGGAALFHGHRAGGGIRTTAARLDMDTQR